MNSGGNRARTGQSLLSDRTYALQRTNAGAIGLRCHACRGSLLHGRALEPTRRGRSAERSQAIRGALRLQGRAWGRPSIRFRSPSSLAGTAPATHAADPCRSGQSRGIFVKSRGLNRPPRRDRFRTVQPMFVYEAMSRRPISTNMLAKTGSKKRSEMRVAR